MDAVTFRKRVVGLKEKLGTLPQDGAWIARPENRRYLSGFKAEDAQLTESSGSLLISEAGSILITDSRFTAQAEAEVVDFEVATYTGEFETAFCERVRNLKITCLGFEEEYVTCGLHRRVSETLGNLSPPVAVEPLQRLVEDLRVVKDPGEIRAMEASARLASVVLDEALKGMAPGQTERDLAWRIEGLAREGGADGLAFPTIVASGPNGALPHAVPTDRRLAMGEPIIVDMGVRLDGYCSDMTRTAFLGEPGGTFRQMYQTVRQAQLAALREVAPGVLSDHPDRVARRVIKDAGYGAYFGHSLGHGVGLATHEEPRLSPVKPTTLLEGMVVTVEPGIYVPGTGGVRLEEMVVIEKDGARILTGNRHFYDFDA